MDSDDGYRQEKGQLPEVLFTSESESGSDLNNSSDSEDNTTSQDDIPTPKSRSRYVYIHNLFNLYQHHLLIIIE